MEKRSIFEDNANRGGVVNVIISTIQAVLDESGLKSQIIGIGVGAPGPLDPVQGKILSPPNLPGASGAIKGTDRGEYGASDPNREGR